jgi:hypothetical protein
MALWLVQSSQPRNTKNDDFLVSAKTAADAVTAAQQFFPAPGWQNPITTQLAELRVVDDDNLVGWRFRVRVLTDPEVLIIVTGTPVMNTLDQIGNELATQLVANGFTRARWMPVGQRLVIAPSGLGDITVRARTLTPVGSSYLTTSFVRHVNHQGDSSDRLAVVYEADSFMYVPL